MIAISVKSDLARLAATLEDLRKRQLPFATARALTATAQAASAAVTAAMPKEFDRPTPFTQRALGIISARKDTLTATVFVKDIQARYLRVQETGGKQVLHGKALLDPKHVKLNQYGNLPRSKLKSLLGQMDVFVGRIRFKKTGQSIWGVWRRPKVGERHDKLGRATGHGAKGGSKNTAAGQRTGLELLIRGAEGVVVPPRFHFGETVQTVAGKEFPGKLRDALEAAMRTAK